MFTSTSLSPQPSPRLGGERELFPFGAYVKMRPRVSRPGELTQMARRQRRNLRRFTLFPIQ